MKRLVSGDHYGFRVVLEGVTREGGDVIESWSDDRREEVRRELTAMLREAIRRGWLPADLPAPSDERKQLLAKGNGEDGQRTAQKRHHRRT